jgi:hypothetical protein
MDVSSSGKGKNKKPVIDIEIRAASLSKSDPFLDTSDSSSSGDDW